MFELHYHEEADVEIALSKLRKLNWNMAMMKADVQLGSELPEIHLSFIPERIIRAVTKIGMNLLAKFATATTPNSSTYAATVSWIKDCQYAILFGNHETYGFIKPAGVAPLACPEDAHKFRLTYNADNERWMMYASFFGGKAATFASIFGPNKELWNTLDVVAPYSKPLLSPIFDTEYKPLEVEVALAAPDILPSIPWRNGETRVGRRRVRRSER